MYEEAGGASEHEGAARLRQQRRRWEGRPAVPLAFCSFPMYRSVNELAIKEWLQVGRGGVREAEGGGGNDMGHTFFHYVQLLMFDELMSGP